MKVQFDALVASTGRTDGVTFEEFWAYTQKLRQPVSMVEVDPILRERLQARFNAVDTNSDGSVTIDEIQAYTVNVRKQEWDQDAQSQVFAKMDADGD